MQVRTIRSDGCLSYVLLAGKSAAVVDPARDIEKYQAVIGEAGATLRFVVDTHTHADHLSGARRLADQADARLVMSARHPDQWRAAAGQADELGIGDILRQNGGVKVDVAVRDGDTLELGGEELRFVGAPGHTQDSVVVVASGRAFTGDALLIGQIGRCDLPGGDDGEMHRTLYERLEALDDETLVYPGHDYEGQTVTALGFERVKNPFLTKPSRHEFTAFMKTAFPSLTGAGMQCGAANVSCDAAASGKPADPLRDEVAGFMDGYFFAADRPENLLPVAELDERLKSGRPFCLLDVREPDEYAGGHIAGAHNLSVHKLDGLLGQVPAGRDDPVVTICRSGKRSGWAAMFLRVAGYRDVRSVPGGMLEWNKQGLPTANGPAR